MGSCAGKKHPRPGPDAHPISHKPNPSASSTSDLPEMSSTELAALRKCSEEEGHRMHHKIKNCYDLVLTGKAVHTTEVNMKFVNLGDEGAAYLAKALPAYRGLKSLRLWKTKLGVGGAKWVGAVLPRLSQLEVLSLEDNDIKAEGTAYVATGLEQVPLLRELYMHVNKMGLQGVTALSTALSTKSHLQILTLDENQITLSGLHLLLAALVRSLPVLTTLGLGFNLLGDEGAKTMQTALKNMPELRKVTLTGNSVSREVESELKQAASTVYIVF